MIPISEIPDWRLQEVGAFAQCEDLTETLVAANKLLGLEGVDQLLTETKAGSTRESLRQAADELARVGLKPLASLIRRHARKARPAQMTTFKARWLR